MSGTKANADPILAKIEAHRAAVTAWRAAGDISGKMDDDDPGHEAAQRLTSKESSREMKALRALLRCRPTTLAGVIALLDHLGQPQLLREKSDGTVLSGTDHWWEENKDEVRAFPHMLAGALRSLIGEPLRPAIDEAGSPR
jgi:hypothetical protein